MRDHRRKVRDWDNDNHIMRKNGRNIRAKIAETLVKAQSSIMTYKALAEYRETGVDHFSEDEFGHA